MERIVRRIRRQESYEPVLEDWLWYGVIPLVGTIALLVAAVLLMSHPDAALFVIAGVMLLFMFNALHNAWDLVTWITILQVDGPENAAQRAPEATEATEVAEASE